MREILLLQKINQSYKSLNLKYSKLVHALFMMGLTSVLEMLGLSVLYPLVLVLSGHSNNHFLPSFSLGFSPEKQVLILFSSVAILYTVKNIVLFFTYNSNINFATYYHRNIVRGLYHAYVYKPLLEFRKQTAGSLANIICAQSEKLVDGIIRPLLVAITEACILLGISALLFFINAGLIITVLITCTGAAGIFYLIFRKTALQWGKNQMHASSTLQELVNNTSMGISEIKIFNKEEYLTEKVYETAEIKTEMFHRLEMYQQTPRYLIETVFIVTVIVYFCVLLYLGKPATVLLAQFSVIAAASFRILPSINRLVGSYSTFSFNVGPGLAILGTLADFNLSAHAGEDVLEKNKSYHFSVDTIELKNITFQYPLTEKLALNHINLLIKKGMRVGISGTSGSGKSTLVRVLTGLYPPTSGEVLVDGMNINEAIQAWQSVIGYVPQEAFILPGSIRENIAFSSQHVANDENIIKILEQVGLGHFVSQLPKGIDTEIGEKGIALSGGQKQLVCMARAIYRRPKIFLLDEPTASLDANNEQLVLQAIHHLPSEITVIMISHKLSNFKNFDTLFTCEAGSLTLQNQAVLDVI